MERGRPTICTPELTRQFCDLIRAGNYFETACAYLQIDKGSAYNWLKRGAAGDDAHGDYPEAYRDFFNAFTQAEAQAEVGSVALLKQAGQPHKLPANLVDPDGKPLPGVQYGDWRATAEFLARRYRDRWAPNAKSSVELTGANGGAVQVESKSETKLILDDPEAVKLASALAARLAPGKTDTCGDG